MTKTILITGATDGIGRETAKALAAQGHTILLHGRNPNKLADVEAALASTEASVETYVADLSRLDEVEALAAAVAERHPSLDVLINNAGVLKAANPITPDGLDLRFVVNTIAPYLLTQKLIASLGASGRVVNLSSAAQAPVDLEALAGRARLGDRAAYAQSKLAITAWSKVLADSLGDGGPAIIAVNPGSLLATKMVKEAFGAARSGVEVGVDILVRAALSDEFADASGRYFDNDSRRFAPPHPDAFDPSIGAQIVQGVEAALARVASA